MRQQICYGAYMPLQFHLSVTCVLHIKTAEHIEILSLSDKPIIVDFCHQGLLCKSDGFTSNGDVFVDHTLL